MPTKKLDEMIEEAEPALPKIAIRAGEIARAIDETEQAILDAGLPVLVRSNMLVQPIYSKYPTSRPGIETQASTLKPITVANLTYMVNKRAAHFTKWNAKEKKDVLIDPPEKVMAGLIDQGHWSFRRCNGVISNPTLRPDGSLLIESGFDKVTGLWHWPDKNIKLDLKEKPTKAEAAAALKLLKDLFSEVAFVSELDRSVVLASLLSTVGRGAFEIAPMHLFRAPSAGSGKSYIVDIISHVATGRWCPVISLTGPKEEIEKRLGALLLEGVSIVSLDNLTRDLEGEILCQMTERPIVKVRVLGLSKTPEIEWRGSLFATGNNVGFAGDMTRRGLVANIDPACEKPEQKTFNKDPIAMVLADRGKYIGAALTIMRAYFVHGKRVKCDPLGSYDRWSFSVREPLIWLGEEDPVKCLEQNREEDPVRRAADLLVEQWAAHLGTVKSFKVAELIECACECRVGSYGVPDTNLPVRAEFRDVLLEQAASRRGDDVDPKRVGQWLRRIKGQVHGGHRIVLAAKGEAHGHYWKLEKMPAVGKEDKEV
jgi:putative DNA primase/helicase